MQGLLKGKCRTFRSWLPSTDPISGFWPEMGQNGRKMDFDPNGKNGEKWPKDCPFWGQFSHFSATFPPFSRSNQNPFFSHFFPISGQRHEMGSAQGNQDRKSNHQNAWGRVECRKRECNKGGVSKHVQTQTNADFGLSEKGNQNAGKRTQTQANADQREQTQNQRITPPFTHRFLQQPGKEGQNAQKSKEFIAKAQSKKLTQERPFVHNSVCFKAEISLSGFWSKSFPENHEFFWWIFRWISSCLFSQGKWPEKIHQKIHRGNQTPKFTKNFREGVSLSLFAIFGGFCSQFWLSVRNSVSGPLIEVHRFAGWEGGVKGHQK